MTTRKTQRLSCSGHVPELERDHFITTVTQTYLAKFPLDANGLAHVRMVQLEVEAHR